MAVVCIGVGEPLRSAADPGRGGLASLDGKPRTKIEFIGKERAPLVVIDDFSADPAALVAAAETGARFRSVVGNFYPGVRAPAPEAYLREVIARLEDPLREIFGLQGAPLKASESNFSLVTTPPYLLDPRQTIPHFDLTDHRMLAVLHYLCPADRGGTSFYRHRGTGFESITRQREDPYLMRLAAEMDALGLPPQAYVDGDTPQFERIAHVDAAFNRLVAYRSVNLHSASIPRDFGFAQDVRKGRLTLNTFMLFGPAPP